MNVGCEHRLQVAVGGDRGSRDGHGPFTGTAGADTDFPVDAAAPDRGGDEGPKRDPGRVNTRSKYVVEEPPQFAVRMEAERQAGKGTHQPRRRPARRAGAARTQGHAEAARRSRRRSSRRGIPDDLMKLGKLGTEPSAIYSVDAGNLRHGRHKEALPFLPEGANVDTLTYAQLTEWGSGSKPRPADARSVSGRSDGTDAQVLPGLFLSILHGRRRKAVQVRRRRRGWRALKDCGHSRRPGP